MSKKWEATLVHGSTYVYGDKFYRLNKPEVITEEVKEYLENHAIATFTTNSGRKFVECKFEFKAVKGGEDEVDGKEDKPDTGAKGGVKKRDNAAKAGSDE